MWERSLQDLIRGLRSHKTSSKAELDAFLEEAMSEIRGELRGKDMELKAEGVVKMCYVSEVQHLYSEFKSLRYLFTCP
jgi:AP-3 complex subunit delta-1